MSELLEKIYVDCALNQAPQYLESFLATQAQGGLTLPLHAPIDLGPFKADLQKAVQVTAGPLQTGTDMTPTVVLSWEPAQGGPFPRFSGKLTVQADDDYDHCAIALRGTYEPPLGAAGKVFDAAVGRTIAHATARELLGRIRDYIESAYQETERKKSASRGV